ncbi:Uncharacterized protein APZ42_007125, partial [Daphnia magna]
QRQLSTRRNTSFSQRSPQLNPPINKTARKSQANDKCFRCKEIGHRANFCPHIKNLKPTPPEGDDGNGKKLPLFEERGNYRFPSIRIKIGNSVVKALFDTGAERCVISNTFFHKLKEGEELINFTKEVDVDLFSINDRRLVTEGTIIVNFFVAEETPRQALRQKFIV